MGRISITFVPYLITSCFFSLSQLGKTSSLDKGSSKPVIILTDFIIIREPVNWLGAVNLCEIYGSRLVVLPHLEDAKLLTQEIITISQPFQKGHNGHFEFGMDRKYWIGLISLVETGTWYWSGVSEEPLAVGYNYWYEGQWIKSVNLTNGNNNKREHCSCLGNPSFKLGDHHHFVIENCEQKHYPICDLPFKNSTFFTLPVTAHPHHGQEDLGMLDYHEGSGDDEIPVS